jgi:hypothetical protein
MGMGGSAEGAAVGGPGRSRAGVTCPPLRLGVRAVYYG